MMADNHAVSNARAWLDTIREAYRIHKKIAEGPCDRDTPIDFEGVPIGSLEDLQQWAAASALSVEVRDAWRTLGEKAEDDGAVEFKILLTTGGPALRIVGDLGRGNSPENARLEYQDWGTPWTSFPTKCQDDDALQWFCEQFYLGD